MRHTKLFKEFLEEFSYLANKCIKLLKMNYNLEGDLRRAVILKNLPPKGEFKEENSISFHFHGSGCYFIIDKQSVDFNFDSYGSFQGFGSYRLRDFAISKQDKYAPFLDKNLIDIYLQKFLKDGLIINVNPPYAIYKLKN